MEKGKKERTGVVSSSRTEETIHLRPVDQELKERGVDDDDTVARIDIDFYRKKKIIAQGLMDFALLAANASQLKVMTESKPVTVIAWVVLVFIIISLVLQVVVGCALAWSYRYKITNENEAGKANKFGNLVGVAILIITILNVIIPIFGDFHQAPATTLTSP